MIKNPYPNPSSTGEILSWVVLGKPHIAPAIKILRNIYTGLLLFETGVQPSLVAQISAIFGKANVCLKFHCSVILVGTDDKIEDIRTIINRGCAVELLAEVRVARGHHQVREVQNRGVFESC